MQKSDSLDKIGMAISIAQPTIKTAIMGSTNPFFKSKYADIGAVWDAIREALSSQKLSILQFPDSIGSEPALTTILLHATGQWISGTYPLVVASKDETAQGYGSAMTYARRYGLAAVMGVIADEDDDGNAASKPPSPPQRAQTVTAPSDTPPSETPMTPAQWLMKGVERVGGLDLEGLTAFTEKHHERIAKLRIAAPDEHAKFMKAVKARYEVLQ